MEEEKLELVAWDLGSKSGHERMKKGTQKRGVASRNEATARKMGEKATKFQKHCLEVSVRSSLIIRINCSTNFQVSVYIVK